MNDKALIEKLREFVGHAVIDGYCSPAGAHKILGILQDHKEDEPLAVLCHEKGFWCSVVCLENDIGYEIALYDEDGDAEHKTFYSPKYETTEQSARAYLNTLPDIERWVK